MTIVTLKVLLVDDYLEDRKTYRRYLLQDKQHTYNILEAETGEQALLLCRQQFPDVIVMDYLLPDMDGLEFLDNLKTQFSQTNIPVIILTNRGNEQIAVQAMKSGAADYLVKKNTTPVSLHLAIQNVLEKTLLSKQLEESEQRFQATFNQAAVGIAHVGPDGQWLLVNQKLCDIVGYTSEELNSLTFQDITHPDDLNRDLEYVRQMLAGEIQTYSMEKRYIRKDKTHVWIDLTVSLVRFSSGEPKYFISVIQDITACKQAQEALQQAHLELERRVQERTTELQQANEKLQITLEELQVTEEELRQQNEELATSRQTIELERQRYQDLFEFAPDGYLVTDTKGNIQEANHAAATLLSIQQQYLIGKPLFIFIAEQERRAFRTRFAHLQEMQYWEVNLKPSSEEPFPAILAVSSLYDHKNQQVGWRWLVRDITIRKRMEQRLQAAHNELEKRVEERTAELSRTNTLLQQKNELLQTIFDHVPVMLMLFDPNGQIKWVNREWETVLGWRMEDIQGRDLLVEFYPDPDYRQYVLDFIATADRRWGDFKTRIRDGTVLDTTWADVRLSDGSYIGIGQNISERKQIEEALRRSEEQRRLVQDLTHTAFWDWDIITDKVIWNDNHYYLLGLKPNEVKPSYQGWRDRVHPEDIDRVERAVKHALDTQSEYEAEYRVIHSDDSHHWLMAWGRGLYDESGQAVRMLGMMFDISDGKQAQEKVREQAALLDVATDAIFVRDLEHRILYWNRGAERMYAWQAAEVLGRNCREFCTSKYHHL
ncbi:MAG: PAS domain S-box protein [Scytonema sp. CRU_2_7]|nr:PAS domain S-box protein [Scytonema sp. CRU_2_7]